jgi:hypothetical protein
MDKTNLSCQQIASQISLLSNELEEKLVNGFPSVILTVPVPKIPISAFSADNRRIYSGCRYYFSKGPVPKEFWQSQSMWFLNINVYSNFMEIWLQAEVCYGRANSWETRLSKVYALVGESASADREELRDVIVGNKPIISFELEGKNYTVFFYQSH